MTTARLKPFAFAIGAEVSGSTCDGRAFSGRVTRIVGPYSVAVDGVGTPASLIHGWPVEGSDEPDQFDYDADDIGLG